MKNTLNNFIKQRIQKKFATDTGTTAHKKLQFIVIDTNTEKGDPNLINKIKSNPELLKLFGSNAKTEIPIAGKINGKFISRRIDRLIVNESEKSVIFLDYKTDTNKEILRDKYVFQMNEYAKLLSDIYTNYSIKCYILWLSDWKLEKII